MRQQNGEAGAPDVWLHILEHHRSALTAQIWKSFYHFFFVFARRNICMFLYRPALEESYSEPASPQEDPRPLHLPLRHESQVYSYGTSA